MLILGLRRNTSFLLREPRSPGIRQDAVGKPWLHSQDFHLVTPGGVSMTRDQYLGAIESGRIDYAIFEPGEMSVRVSGDLAILRYRAELEATYDGQAVPRSAYWHTHCYERKGPIWQAVWSQATAAR
ncbi:nuclear transport factor 2 family protein [Arthrobacter sp. ISL-5]|uniref:nuclear transport factor 2 family protein n=1 Tax=Arthrobacter sp. ISL-5 TaxID=2819111 RepID=UPI001BE6E55F|nr:nuclear transport factor 2 family protein [Arthrobacter sp. ISL-5]